MPLTSAVFRFASLRFASFFFLSEIFAQICYVTLCRIYLFFIFYKQSFAAFPAFRRIASCILRLSLRCRRRWLYRIHFDVFVTQHSVSDLYVIASLSAPTPARMLLPYASLWQVSVSVCEFVPQLLGDRVIGRYTPLLRLLLALLVFVQHAATANNPSVQGVQGCCIAGLHCLRCQRGRSSQVSISVVVLQPHFIAPSGCNYFNFVWQHVH